MAMSARFPMSPYPTSWYRVMNSEDLPADEPRQARYFGRDLVVFRDASGSPRTLDAHCPHLGASLAVGGRVVAGEVECPFHGWRFDAEGRCTAMAYPGRVPPRAQLRGYPTEELNGVVAVFFDEAGRPPTWTVPAIDGYEDTDSWSERAWNTWVVKTHVQEVFENGPDAVHQRTLHCALEFPDSWTRTDGVLFHGGFGALYEAGPLLPDAVATQQSTYTDVGLGFTHLDMVLDFDGLQVHRQIQFCLTPIDDETIDATLSTRMRRLDDDDLTDIVHREVTFHTWRSFAEDIPVWENKVYRPLPDAAEGASAAAAMLCEADRDLVRLRHWVRQFYPDGAAVPMPRVMAGTAAR